MIAMLRGEVVEVEAVGIVLECAGVGFGIKVTGTDHGLLQSGVEVRVYIYEHIKEDAHDLYGFLSKETKQLFEQLLTVKNVGPKVAMALLDIDSVNGVKSAIAEGDVKKLQSAKGVGKRAAEQIVVELRDKVGIASDDRAESVITRGAVRQSDEALMALLSLGYVESDALEALSIIDASLSTEERIRLALRR
ncbi:Holliday junction branch migration protein RuvA [soil metagenome]